MNFTPTSVAFESLALAVPGVALDDQMVHAAHPEAVVIDQSAIGTSSRSTPATYTGVMDDLRKELADANDVDAGLFSFNSKGACEAWMTHNGWDA